MHLTHGEERWVSLGHGIHNPASGSHIPVYVDPGHVYVFGADGELVIALAAAPAA
ncbi:MAG: hypothetical protein R3E95_17735 [Thiolinea sp.]